MPSTLGCKRPRTPEPLFSWQLDRERRTHPLACQIARPDSVGFFVWGRAKELVYKTEITTREELLQRIEAAFEIMKQEMQMKVTTTEVRNRCRKCIRNGGGHFEHQQ